MIALGLMIIVVIVYGAWAFKQPTTPSQDSNIPPPGLY